jgi:hypothetical protein
MTGRFVLRRLGKEQIVEVQDRDVILGSRTISTERELEAALA